MTYEEAIERINDVKCYFKNDYEYSTPDYVVEAIDLAIEALKKQVPKKQKTTRTSVRKFYGI